MSTESFPSDGDTLRPVLLLGHIARETICHAIQNSGRKYRQKHFNSSPENWDLISVMIENNEVDLILGKLSESDCRSILHDDYAAAGKRLFTAIASVPHAIFAHLDLCAMVPGANRTASDEDEDEGQDEFFRSSFAPPPLSEDEKGAVEAELAQRGIEIVPFERNLELTTLAVEVVERLANGLLFRVYVPHSQVYSGEASRFLALFRDYMENVTKVDLRVSERRTSTGTIYDLCSHSLPSTSALAEQFDQFSAFVRQCVSSPGTAEKILSAKGISPLETAKLLARFGKEGRRLDLDLKQERESKLMSLRHRLQSELLDTEGGTSLSDEELDNLANSILPVTGFPLPQLTSGPKCIGNSLDTASHLTFNVSQSAVRAINSVVVDQQFGGMPHCESDERILTLIAKHAPDNNRELVDALKQALDRQAPAGARVSARQLLATFLKSAASKAGAETVGTLTSYLNSLFT